MTPGLDPALVAEIQPLLEPDEQVAWVGRPDPKHFAAEGRAGFALGVLVLAIAGGLGAVALWVDNAFCPALFAVPVAVLGFGALLLPWWLAGRVSRVVYAITDRGAILIRPIGYARHDVAPTPRQAVYRFDRATLAGRQRIARHGSRIDLVFAEEAQRRPGGRTVTIDLGFLGLARPEEAEAVLDQLFPVR
jgi:hypothetical protein